jgi:hypothetical protein
MRPKYLALPVAGWVCNGSTSAASTLVDIVWVAEIMPNMAAQGPGIQSFELHVCFRSPINCADALCGSGLLFFCRSGLVVFQFGSSGVCA